MYGVLEKLSRVWKVFHEVNRRLRVVRSALSWQCSYLCK